MAARGNTVPTTPGGVPYIIAPYAYSGLPPAYAYGAPYAGSFGLVLGGFGGGWRGYHGRSGHFGGFAGSRFGGHHGGFRGYRGGGRRR